MAKHMRLPNGFGQISKLKQRLRNSWRAMVTTGWTDEGKPVRKIVGYYHTYNDAYTALVKYHDDPLGTKTDVSMIDLYDMWYEDYSKRVESTKIYTAAWNYCESLYPMMVKDVRSFHIKQVVEADMPPSMHKKVHQLLNMMFDYAIEYDMTDKNYSRKANPYYDHQTSDKAHVAFTEEEIMELWRHLDIELCDAALIGIYSGWRPDELMNLRIENINMDDWTMIGGMKTNAGKDRIVPIHDAIKPLIEKKYNSCNEFLFGDHNYKTYRYRFIKLNQLLGMNKPQPHNTRVTFVTLAKKYEVDEYAIKRIVGHHIKDLTEKTYTEREVGWLRNEISKIPCRF